jgi:hypothetical protein
VGGDTLAPVAQAQVSPYATVGYGFTDRFLSEGHHPASIFDSAVVAEGGMGCLPRGVNCPSFKRRISYLKYRRWQYLLDDDIQSGFKSFPVTA